MKAPKRRGKARVGISINFLPDQSNYPNKKVRTGKYGLFLTLFLSASDNALSNFLREENYTNSKTHMEASSPRLFSVFMMRV